MEKNRLEKPSGIYSKCPHEFQELPEITSYHLYFCRGEKMVKAQESQDFQQRRLAARQLYNSFYSAFDRSLAQDTLTKLAQAKKVPGTSKIGEGVHFAAFQVSRGSGMALVIKMTVGDWAASDGPTGRRWRQALKTLKDAGPGAVCLMPPFELIDMGGPQEATGLVMPFAGDPWKSLKAPWAPLPARLTEMEAGLKELGLLLDDVEQGGVCEGVPIVYDLSDLRPR